MTVRPELIRFYSQVHTALLRATRGRLLGRFGRLPILLLTTTGRRSGKRRTIPLGYIEDADALVVIASNDGHDSHPLWYRNLQANPSVRVCIRASTRQMTARVASPLEHERLWPRVLDVWPGYAEYQQRTTRQIPVVILTEAEVFATH